IDVDPDNPKYYSMGKSVFDRETGALVFELKSYEGKFKQDGYLVYYDKHNNATLERYSPKINSKFLKTPSQFYVDSVEYKVTAISGAYMANKFLQEVEISDGVEKIDTCAFTDCKNLKTVKMPDTLVKIGGSVFWRCDKLKNVRFSQSLREIGKNAFSWCNKLKTVALPDSVKIIREYAFAFCKNLVKIVLPSNLEIIQEYAFAKCEKLKSLYIPASVKYISGVAFKFCAKLQTLEVDPENEYYFSKNGFIAERATGIIVARRGTK
ncbi:MAG: leucine-rich repeat domain-containing protein, partial [Clostridia bacterium]|nr:leucine-rich repeat domain-containing protein [Clostridia bacterium]